MRLKGNAEALAAMPCFAKSQRREQMGRVCQSLVSDKISQSDASRFGQDEDRAPTHGLC
jgi:hypothetical protein